MEEKNLRILHWCLKIANRPASIEFYRDKLEMTVLRHEEFAEGCEATCNGPYSNRWSKTMIGYGTELSELQKDSNFILELTYNYDVKSYDVGNDYNGIVVESTRLFDKLSSLGKVTNDVLIIHDPDGYPVQFVKGDSNKVIRLELNVEKVNDSVEYWSDTLGMKQIEKGDKYVDLAFKDDHPKLRLVEIGKKIDHKTGYGRLAFTTPKKHQNALNEKILASNKFKFRHQMTELGTPGKQTVTVIILLSHPDEYEICFVNFEDYSVLATTDPNANEELERELKKEAKKNAN